MFCDVLMDIVDICLGKEQTDKHSVINSHLSRHRVTLTRFGSNICDSITTEGTAYIAKFKGRAKCCSKPNLFAYLLLIQQNNIVSVLGSKSREIVFYSKHRLLLFNITIQATCRSIPFFCALW